MREVVQYTFLNLLCPKKDVSDYSWRTDGAPYNDFNVV
jgi:hypothetical protein